MSTIIVYILIMVFLAIRSYLNNKAKENNTPLPPEEEAITDDEPTAEPIYEKKKSFDNYDFINEGSDRIIIPHTETTPKNVVISEKDLASTANEEQPSMTIDDMRQALIYKTILDRIEY